MSCPGLAGGAVLANLGRLILTAADRGNPSDDSSICSSIQRSALRQFSRKLLFFLVGGTGIEPVAPAV